MQKLLSSSRATADRPLHSNEYTRLFHMSIERLSYCHVHALTASLDHETALPDRYKAQTVHNPMLPVSLSRYNPLLDKFHNLIHYYNGLFPQTQQTGHNKTEQTHCRSAPYHIRYLSSLKYASPRLAGGWFSRLLRILVTTRTTSVTTQGIILYSS